MIDVVAIDGPFVRRGQLCGSFLDAAFAHRLAAMLRDLGCEIVVVES